MPVRKWIGRLVLATVVPPTTVEALLQIGSVCAAWLAPSEQLDADSQCAVLCVGDSFTYGLGASDPAHSYPRCLERLLHSDPIDGRWCVANGGWPGRNSRTVLEEFPRQLREHHPRFVAALVGINDVWSRPSRFELADVDDPRHGAGNPSRRFRLEWRLPRLIALLRRGSPAGDRVEPAALTVEALEPISSPPEPEVEPEAQPSGSRKARAQERESLASAGRAALNRRDFTRALEIDTRWVEIEAENPRAHQSRVEPAARLGRADVVEAEVAWLRRHHEEHPDQAASEALLAALQTANPWREVTAVANADAGRFPESEAIWRAIATAADRQHDNATAERALARSLAVGQDDAPALRAWKLRIRAGLRGRRGDLRGAQRDMLEACLLVGNDAKLRQMVPIHLHRKDLDLALLEQLGAELGAPREKLERAKKIFVESLDPEGGGAAEVLDVHLREIVNDCRRQGAEPLLLTYPMRKEQLAIVQRRVAEEMGVRLVDLEEQFAAALKVRARNELFVPDGHLSDLGYESVAREVAATIHALAHKDR